MALHTRQIQYIVIFVFIGNFLLPPLAFFNLGIRMGDILVILLSPLVFFLKTRKTLPIILYSMFCISVFFSMIWGYAFLNVPPTLRDLNELLRLTLPLSIFFLSYNTVDAKFWDLLYSVIIYGSIFLILIALLQLYFSQGFIGKFLTLYISNAQLEKMASPENLGAILRKRLFLTGSEPNTGAAIAIFFGLNNLSLYFSNAKYKYLLLFIVLSIIIGLTGSRTGILALSMGCIATITLHKQKKSTLLNLKKIIIFLCVFLILFVSAIQSDYIKVGFRAALSGDNASVNVRLKNFYDAFKLFKASPMLGWGPAKAIHATIVDGEYFLMLRRYGIFGLFFSLFFLLTLIRSLLKQATKMIDFYGNSSYAITIANASYIISMMVMMFTNNFISGYQIFLPILGIIGAIHSLSIIARRSYNAAPL